MKYDKKTNTTKDGVISRWLKEAEIYDQTSTLEICQNIKEEQNICTNGDKYLNGNDFVQRWFRSVDLTYGFFSAKNNENSQPKLIRFSTD